MFDPLFRLCKARASSFIRLLSTHTLYLSTMIPFSVFLVTVIWGIMIWFSGVAGNELKKSVLDSAIHQTEVSSESIRVAFQDYVDLSAKLSLLNPLSPRFYQGSHEAYQVLKNYNLSSFKFSNLAIYYPNEPIVITTQGSCDFSVLFSEVPETNKLKAFLNETPGTYITSTYLYGVEAEKAKILFVQPLSNQHKAVYILDSIMLKRLLFENEQTNLDKLFLYSDENDLLWTNEAIAEDLKESLVSFIESDSGSVQTRSNSGSYIGSRSPISHGISLVRMSPVRNQFQRVQTITMALVVLCVVLLLLGVAVMAFSHKHSFAPVQNMLNSFQKTGRFSTHDSGDVGMLQEIHSEFSRLLNENQQTIAMLSSDQLRSLLVLRILCGRYSDMTELKNICNWLSITFPYTCFFASIFLFNRVITEEEYNDILQKIQIAEEKDTICYCCLSPDEKSIVAIVNMKDSRISRAEWGSCLITRCAPDHRFTLGIGNIYQDVSSLGKSYIEARAAIDYRLIKGENICICYDVSIERANEDPYPQQLLRRYFEALQSWDVEQIDASLQTIISYVSTHALSLQQVKCICFDLTSSFLRQAHTLGAHSDKIVTMLDVFSIAEYNSIGELVDKIQKYSVEIRRHIAANAQTTDEKLLQRVSDCLRENISNSQFSLNDLADYTGVTIQTIRKKVKESTGLTLSGYFTGLRIEHAKKLLSETPLSLQAICEQCGYLDVSSFIRLFKAEEGMSPGKYREEKEIIQDLITRNSNRQ